MLFDRGRGFRVMLVPVMLFMVAPAFRAGAESIDPQDKGTIRELTTKQFAHDQDRYHEVKAGENLHWIAATYYGNPRLWKKIFEANRDKLSNPNQIEIGQKLLIPANVALESK